MKDYDCVILYHHGKAIVVADALRLMPASTLNRDLCLRMVIISPLLYLINKEQVDGFKRENYKEERIMVQISTFVRDSHGLLTQCGKVWVPVAGGVREKLLEEAHKFKFLIRPGATNIYSDLILS